MGNLALHAWDYRQGRTTSQQFFHVTSKDWSRMAVHLCKRWRSPTWYQEEEVRQELMLAGWRAVWNYRALAGRPESPQGLGSYILYNAMDGAKKKLHKARGAILHGNADAAESRFETPTDYSDWSERLLTTPATQEQWTEKTEHLQRVHSLCRSESERIVLQMLVQEGDILEAAVALYNRKYLRSTCGLVEPRDAGYLVADVAHELVRRLHEAEAV